MKLKSGLFVDSRLFETDPSPETAKQLFKSYVRNVHLEIFSYCNRRCQYCPVSRVDRISANKYMRDEVFERIACDLRSINYSGNVSFNLYNEPMADDCLYGRLSQLRGLVPDATVYFNTNGDYLNRESAQKIADIGVSHITVTLHPGPTSSYDDLDVLSRFTELSARICRKITVKRFALNKSVFGETSFDGLMIKVMAQNYKDVGVNRGGTVEAGPKVNRTAPCNRPFHDFTVYHDGSIFPCCQFFPDLGTHDACRAGYVDPTREIFQLYTSEIMASFRRGLFDYSEKKAPCDGCAEAMTVVATEVGARRKMLEALSNGRSVEVESVSQDGVTWRTA